MGWSVVRSEMWIGTSSSGNGGRRIEGPSMCAMEDWGLNWILWGFMAD